MTKKRFLHPLLLGIAVAVTLIMAVPIHPAKAEPSPATTSTNSDAADKANAVRAMESWLELNDQGKYEEAWKEAAPIFKENVSAAQWSAAAKQVRAPLGKTLERKLASAALTTSVPNPKGGKPLDGEWVIAQFQTRFENLLSAIETVTFEKGKDGTWKAAGYYIKPAT